MKNFYHCLIMWVPFIVLFVLAGIGLEILEGNKIRTTEYWGLDDVGMMLVFTMCALACIFYLVSFLPLTFFVTKFIESLPLKIVIFTLTGSLLGWFGFTFYDESFVREYQLNMMSAIILFSIAGLLYALIENTVKKNIKFR